MLGSFLWFCLQPGISASVSYREQTIWSKGFGVNSKTGSATPPDGDSIFRIGSVSKVFAVRWQQASIACWMHAGSSCPFVHFSSSIFHCLAYCY